MSIKQRLQKLEKQQAEKEPLQIHVYILDSDGGATQHGSAGQVSYTAAEYQALCKEWEARGDTILNVKYASAIQ